MAKSGNRGVLHELGASKEFLIVGGTLMVRETHMGSNGFKTDGTCSGPCITVTMRPATEEETLEHKEDNNA